jgi:GntR family transcriptional regulator, vanillate catabolism transcriptional regulator
LHEMILSGELRPGERLTEAGLAERMGLSRTPIRVVLPALAAEGLLDPVGRRGYAVKAFSETESLQALNLRAALEGLAARALAERGPPTSLLRQLDDCLAAGNELFEARALTPEDVQTYGRMNGRFHALIVDSADSPLLESFVARLNRLPFIAPEIIAFDKIDGRAAFTQLFRAHGDHLAIVDALRARDATRAEFLFREHANRQRQSMFGTEASAARAAGRIETNDGSAGDAEIGIPPWKAAGETSG